MVANQNTARRWDSMQVPGSMQWPCQQSWLRTTNILRMSSSASTSSSSSAYDATSTNSFFFITNRLWCLCFSLASAWPGWVSSGTASLNASWIIPIFNVCVKKLLRCVQRHHWFCIPHSATVYVHETSIYKARWPCDMSPSLIITDKYHTYEAFGGETDSLICVE